MLWEHLKLPETGGIWGCYCVVTYVTHVKNTDGARMHLK